MVHDEYTSATRLEGEHCRIVVGNWSVRRLDRSGEALEHLSLGREDGQLVRIGEGHVDAARAPKRDRIRPTVSERGYVLEVASRRRVDHRQTPEIPVVGHAEDQVP